MDNAGRNNNAAVVDNSQQMTANDKSLELFMAMIKEFKNICDSRENEKIDKFVEYLGKRHKEGRRYSGYELKSGISISKFIYGIAVFVVFSCCFQLETDPDLHTFL